MNTSWNMRQTTSKEELITRNFHVLHLSRCSITEPLVLSPTHLKSHQTIKPTLTTETIEVSNTLTTPKWIKSLYGRSLSSIRSRDSS